MVRKLKGNRPAQAAAGNQMDITFMSTDKGLKSASRYIKSTGEKKRGSSAPG